MPSGLSDGFAITNRDRRAHDCAPSEEHHDEIGSSVQSHDQKVVVRALIEKYAARVPRVRRANSVNSVVDLLCQQYLYDHPRTDYKDALAIVLSDDELRRAYAES